MDKTLNAVERRVIGSLLEKSLTQPDYYPMTLNAVVTACNQKSNRDPVMDLDDEAVWQALEDLRQRGAVSKILPAPGARNERFKHEVKDYFNWGPRQQAVMTELLLRGPQTVGELRGRCARLYKFESLDAVTMVLTALAEADPSMTRPMPREPGRSAIRHTHLLYPEDETPAEVSAAPAPPAHVSAGPAPVAAASHDGLRDELDNLQAELAELHESLAELRRRVDTLESQHG